MEGLESILPVCDFQNVDTAFEPRLVIRFRDPAQNYGF